jgi:hypothetical protein
MTQILLCPECRVPEQFTMEHLWLNSGIIVQRNDPSSRLCFMECENLDPLYEGIGKSIGMPIDHMVIDIILKGTANYVGNIIPQEVKDTMKSEVLGAEVIIGALSTRAQLYGYGKYEFVGYRYEGDKDDYLTIRVTEPYSLLLCCGSLAGSIEAVMDIPQEAAYKEISPGVFEVKSCMSEHNKELKERLRIKKYLYQDGDMELERCSSCGGPKALSSYKWSLDRGIIANTGTARRMALIGPGALDPVFEELEKELGETIPHAVVEAQRRFVKEGFYSIEEISDEEAFRTQLALRGLGNLREMEIGANGLHMRIDNAAGHLMIVGLAQGLFDMAFDLDSHVEWEVSENADLELEVSP